MKKIALITWYDSLNYGTCIQCIALSKYLKSKGYNVVIPSKYSYFTFKDPADFVRRTIRKICNKIHPVYQSVKFADLPGHIKTGYQKRQDSIREVIKNELTIYCIKGNNSFKELNNMIDVFLTGSDQIWNPNHISSTMLLNFVSNRKVKVAYASSFGVSKLPKRLKNNYKKYLSRFNNIGVREKSAVSIIKDLNIAVPIKQVLDPTLLLGSNDIVAIGNKAKIKNEISDLNGFIFCYFIGSKLDWQKDAQVLAQTKDLEIVICLSESNIVPNFGNIYSEAGPYEFVWLINHAKYIMTDSFHATAISMSLNKEFFVYKRFNDDDSLSQNSRLYDLLSDYGLTNRMISPNNKIVNIIDESIEYSIVNKVLERNRKKSERFLLDSIEER